MGGYGRVGSGLIWFGRVQQARRFRFGAAGSGGIWRSGTGEARRGEAGQGGYGVEICGEMWWDLAVEAWRVTDWCGEYGG